MHVVKDGKIERRSVTLGARNVERGVVTVKEGLENGRPGRHRQGRGHQGRRRRDGPASRRRQGS